MKVEFLARFSKDLDKLQSTSAARKTIAFIHQVKDASSLQDLQGVKKMKGTPNAFRYRVGDYRIGFFLQDNTVQLARIVHRKDIYRYFP